MEQLELQQEPSPTKEDGTIVIQLNAFDKDSSASHSKKIKVSCYAEFKFQLVAFESGIPFSRYYYDNEVETSEDQATLKKWEKEAGIA